jgi:hypothetical protein
MTKYVNIKTGAVDENVPTKETFKAELDKKLNLSGGIMSGDLTLPIGKHLNADSIVLGNKDTDENVQLVVNANNNNIAIEFSGSGKDQDVLLSMVKTPLNSNDAANKQYVDNAVANAVPNTTSSDNNKFLRVVNGTPTWVALTNVAEEGA